MWFSWLLNNMTIIVTIDSTFSYKIDVSKSEVKVLAQRSINTCQRWTKKIDSLDPVQCYWLDFLALGYTLDKYISETIDSSLYTKSLYSLINENMKQNLHANIMYGRIVNSWNLNLEIEICLFTSLAELFVLVIRADKMR